MTLAQQLSSRHIILASGSPRRQQFLTDLGLTFEVRLKQIDETYPATLKQAEVAEYLAQLKAEAYRDELRPEDVLVTGDTVVCLDDIILGKPKSVDQATQMLQSLSGRAHHVISSACVSSLEKSEVMHATTKVYFKTLTPDEITYYINTFKPFDKAGAYGIQEWIGQIGIERIEGSFYNVMGLPIGKLYNALKNF